MSERDSSKSQVGDVVDWFRSREWVEHFEAFHDQLVVDKLTNLMLLDSQPHIVESQPVLQNLTDDRDCFRTKFYFYKFCLI